MPTASLVIPATAEHVRTARLVAVAAARRAGFDEVELDDVRLAVGEVVTRAVLARPESPADTADAGELALALRDDGHVFEVEVDAGAAAAALSSAPDHDGDVSIALVRAIVPDVRVEGGTVVLGWPHPARSAASPA